MDQSIAGDRMAIATNEPSDTFGPVGGWTALALITVFLLFCLPFAIHWHSNPTPAFYSMALAAALTGWLSVCVLMASGGRGRLFRGSALFWLICAAHAAISVLFSHYFYSAQWLFPLVAFLVAAVAASSMATLRLLVSQQRLVEVIVAGLLFGAVFQSFTGWLQMLGVAESFAPIFFALKNNPTVMGAIAQPNNFAHYLYWAIFGLLWILAQPSSRMFARIAGMAVVGWLMLLASFTGSRTVLLYLCAGAVFAAFHWKFRPRPESVALVRYFAAAVFLGLSFQFAARLIISGIGEFYGVSLSGGAGLGKFSLVGLGGERVLEWVNSMQLLSRHPFFGAGWHNYAYETFVGSSVDVFREQSRGAVFNHSHNLIGQIAAEQGLVGLALLGAGAGFLVRWIVRAQHTLLGGFAILLIVTLLHSQVEYPLWYLHFFVCFALVVACVEPRLCLGATFADRSWGRRGLLAAGVVLMILSVGAALGFGWIVRNEIPSGTMSQRIATWNRLKQISRVPGLDYTAEFVMINYSVTMPWLERDKGLSLIERQAFYRPHIVVLAEYVCALGRQGDSARRASMLGHVLSKHQERARFLYSYLDRRRC